MVFHQMIVLSENNAHNSRMHHSQSQTVVVDQVRRVLELSTSDALDHQIIVVVPSPTQKFPCHRPWSLGCGPMQYERIPT
jgi:hypothetical protein